MWFMESGNAFSVYGIQLYSVHQRKAAFVEKSGQDWLCVYFDVQLPVFILPLKDSGGLKYLN